MGRGVIWWQLETGDNRWQIEQTVVFATHDDSHPRREEFDEDSSIPVQAIQANQNEGQRHTEPSRIADDGLAGTR
jgi:hypothetical protein